MSAAWRIRATPKCRSPRAPDTSSNQLRVTGGTKRDTEPSDFFFCVKFPRKKKRATAGFTVENTARNDAEKRRQTAIGKKK